MLADKRITFLKLTFCLVFFGLSRPVLAQTGLVQDLTDTSPRPIIRSAAVSAEEFDAYVAAHHLISFSDSFDQTRPGVQNSKHLKTLIERAQNAWLGTAGGASTEKARTLFKEIAELSLDADWQTSEREAIHYSMLRLAQLEDSNLLRDAWLEKAAARFGDTNVNHDLFPPPLVDAYGLALKRVHASMIRITPARTFPQAKYLFVNGRRFEITSDLEISLPASESRVTAVSDAFPPLTERFGPQQMAVFRAEEEPIAGGDCEAPKTFGEGTAGEVTVLFERGCVRELNHQQWVTKLTDSTRHKQPLLSEAKPFEQFHDPVSEIKSENHHTWLWIGAGVLALGAAAALEQNLRASNDSTTPTHHTGF